MRRRSALLGGLAATLAAAPAIARAQTARLRRIGVLMSSRASDRRAARYVSALTNALDALGWKDGVNVHIEWRWAGGNPELFERYAAELASLEPDVVLAESSPAVRAVRAKMSTIPIVFTIVTDPVGQGLVDSMAHPGGNITGFTDFDPLMIGKWMEFLTLITPPVRRAALLFNPATAPFAGAMLRAAEEVAALHAIVVRAASCPDDAAIEATMAGLERDGGGGLVTLPDVFNIVHRETILAAAAEHRVPAIYFLRSFAEESGLMSYGVDYIDQVRRAADYLDRLLKGARAGELPVQEPVKFDFLINLKTAKSLGLELSPTLLALADEVIE